MELAVSSHLRIAGQLFTQQQYNEALQSAIKHSGMTRDAPVSAGAATDIN